MQSARNVKFVAYLRFRKIHPDKMESLGRGRANYLFDMDETKWQALKVEFDSMDVNRDGFVTNEESQADDSIYYQDNDDLFEIMDY